MLERFFGGWMNAIPRKELDEVIKVLTLEYTSRLICPSQGLVFKAFELCKYEDLRVVMLGQDPYPQKDVATGVLFGNKNTTLWKDLSPSLKVLINSFVGCDAETLSKEEQEKIYFDTTLERWAQQGVLMINSALSVEMNKVGSHTMMWRKFMSEFFKNLSKKNPNLIYVLFGNQAQTFTPYISQNNHVLCCKHPAYYARDNSFHHYTEFDEINKILTSANSAEIQWYVKV